MFRLRLAKVAGITAFWTVLSLVQPLYDELVYRAYQADVSFYSFGRSLALNPLAALVGGPIAAGIVIFFIKERLRRQPFWLVVAAHALTYVTVILVLTWTGNLWYFSLELGRPLLDPTTLSGANAWFFGPWTVRNLLFWTGVATLTSFLVEVFDILGPGFWTHFVLGRYQRPRPERRTFLFLDLAGSTPLAERLGPERYHEFLAETYRDLAEPIARARGEIYQYVGDEVIVSWRDRQGLEDARCLSCLSLVRATLAARAPQYEARYGAVPSFRAAFHQGVVMAGEIGVLTRDLVFTGDVLNTAARIQERCRDLAVEALASEAIVDGVRGAHAFTFEPIETVALRGKAEPVTVYALHEARPAATAGGTP
ncbi:MAG: adenylate/guanylate cyclase domain-containing protein [Gemmatimonadota bacterium]